MRRIAVWTSLCVLLLGCSLSRGHAQQISIAGDINSSEMKMDISLRDADLNEVLTAMFNTTGGKYQLQVGNGVVGRIPRLQLIQTPFDNALDAILGTEYSYTRRQIGNGNYLYTISGRGSSTVPDTGATVPTMAPMTPSSSISTSADSSTSASSTPASTRSSSSPPTLLTITQKKVGTGKAGEAATTETLVINSIKINNLDIEALCAALGGTAVKLFVQNSTGGTGAPAVPGANNTTSNNNNNNNGYNNNGYNNNNNNNNGYNNNNNNGYNNNNNNGYNNNNNNGYNNNNNNRYSNSTTSNNLTSGITSGLYR